MGDEKGNSSNVVRDSEKSAIRPAALGGTGGGDKPKGLKGDHINEKGNSEASSLADAENNASKGGFYSGGDNVDEARKAEEGLGGFYASNRGKNGRGQKKDKGKRRGGLFIKKNGPIFTILISVAVAGGILTGLQSFQPFSLIAQFTESFNSMQSSANKRSNFFLRLQMDSGRVKSPSKGTIFGDHQKFSITKKQAAKLKQQGIEYVKDFEGSGVGVLKFDDGTDTPKIIVMNESDIGKIKGGNAFTFDNMYSANSDFFHGYNAASMTWRGAIAGWFGEVTVKFLQSNNLTRNMFADFQKKVKSAKAGNTKSVAQEILAERTGTIEDGGAKMKGADEEAQDADGNSTRRPVDGGEIVPGSNGSKEPPSPTNMTGKEGESEAVKNSFGVTEGTDSSGGKFSRADMTADTVRTKLDDISGKVQKGANIACTVLNVVGSINLLVTAAEALQIINLTTAYFETIDKTKAGFGDDTPIHDFTNALNEQKEATYSPVGTLSLNGSDVSTNVPSEKDNVTRTRSAMQSSGVGGLYSGTAVDPNDASVKTFNISSSIKGILGGLGASMAMYEGCAIAKVVSNMVSAITSAIEIAGCILGAVGAAFTFGMSASACAPLAAKIAKGVALSIAIGVAVAAVISIITPIVSQALTRDLITNIGGEDLGNALTSGANMYLGNTHRANGGSLSTYDKYKQFAMAREDVIAENARYERESLSPFDITSKNTFMGTFLTKLMGFQTTRSLMGALATSSSVISSSITSLTPGAKAFNVAETLPTQKDYEDTCPYLASIGAVGDAFCNPYTITDMSTSEVDPADVITYLDSDENFPVKNFSGETSDGDIQNVKIAGDSELAKYILYCDQRESAFGIADQNIGNEIGDWATVKSGDSTVDSVANSAIGAIPVFGDVVDVVTNTQILSNIGYVSGESCVAGNTVQSNLTEGADESMKETYASESSSWNKAKYFQRFVEDQSLAESMGIIEKSAVATFVDEYREDHPLDNSYEGILARKSGLTKDTVVAILDLVDYAEYVANYDPSTRYAFGEPVVKVEKTLRYDNENTLAGDPVLPRAISYADVRNRSFAV